MKKTLKWRVILLAGATILAILFFLPSLPGFKAFPAWWKGILPSKPITLGLDLQGGMHIVFKVQGDKAVENSVARVANDIVEIFSEKKINIVSAKAENISDLVIRYSDTTKGKEIIDEIKKQYPGFSNERDEPGEAVFRLSSSEKDRIKESAVSQSLEKIRNRIDQYGVKEPLIQQQGTDELLVQLPGVKDPKRVIELIGKTAILEFKLVDEDADIRKAIEGQIPEGDEILFSKEVDPATKVVRQTIPYLLKSKSLMTGDVISDATVSIDPDMNEPFVSITFNSIGAKEFDKITGENVKKRLAIVLDGNVYSAPVIQDRISGGKAQITGRFSMEEAKDLSIVLREGALPAPVEIIQNLTVGPSLGKDSIEKGIKATIIAGIFVLLFMVIYYKLSGLIANFAMVLNLIILIGALAALDATLTLPGIAGIILTIGMGVDSNVLIFARIREELKAGKPVRSAIDSGYDKAIVTILDSHVTTLLTAIVLFIFGTGPIKGFAVTLSLGIIINLFTALVGTKAIYDFINSRVKLERLSI
ncbi:MAG TPA: protein translocase subunit SecD [Nitrospiraceae bacterium]|nr:protein translocase subunit SecD [Nitrospiraceae bacterium]